MAGSYLVVNVFNGGLIAGGVLLAVFANYVAGIIIDQVPNYISDDLISVTTWFDEGLIIFGALIGALGIWGFVGFTCKIRWMIVIYLVLIVFLCLLHLCAGALFLINKGRESFVVFDSTIQDEIRTAMNPYCDDIPLDSTDPSLLRAFGITLPGQYDRPAARAYAEEQYDTNPVVADELQDINEKYVQPLVDIGITECQIPNPFQEKDTCRTEYQYPCQVGLVSWINDKLFWIGVVFAGIGFWELFVVIFGIKYYKKINRQYQQKRHRDDKKHDREEKKKNEKADKARAVEGRPRRRSSLLAGEGVAVEFAPSTV